MSDRNRRDGLAAARTRRPSASPSPVRDGSAVSTATADGRGLPRPARTTGAGARTPEPAVAARAAAIMPRAASAVSVARGGSSARDVCAALGLPGVGLGLRARHETAPGRRRDGGVGSNSRSSGEPRRPAAPAGPGGREGGVSSSGPGSTGSVPTTGSTTVSGGPVARRPGSVLGRAGRPLVAGWAIMARVRLGHDLGAVRRRPRTGVAATRRAGLAAGRRPARTTGATTGSTTGSTGAVAFVSKTGGGGTGAGCALEDGGRSGATTDSSWTTARRRSRGSRPVPRPGSAAA